MAKVVAPLLSLNATGTVAGELTFSRHKRLHVAKTIPSHPDAKSPDQLAQRDLYRHALDYWLTLTLAERAQLLTAARPRKITGLNLLVSQFLHDELALDAWYPAHDAAPNPQQDYSLHANHLNTIAHTTTIDRCGQPFGALECDGATTYCYGANQRVGYTSEDFTIIARVYPTISKVHKITTRGVTFADGWYFTLTALPLIYLATEQPGQHQATLSAALPTIYNSWHTIAATRQGTIVNLYYDGVDVTVSHDVHQDPTYNPDRVLTLSAAGIGGGENIQGRLDDVLFFRRALTPAEHATIHARLCTIPRL